MFENDHKKCLKYTLRRKSWGKSILLSNFHSGPSVGTGIQMMLRFH